MDVVSTGCPNKMLTLFGRLFLLENKRHMIFNWLSRAGSKLKSVTPIKSYDGQKIEYKIVIGTIFPLKCTQRLSIDFLCGKTYPIGQFRRKKRKNISTVVERASKF